jgi:hypothetical protein
MYEFPLVGIFPVWLLYIITALIAFLSMEAGWRYGDYRRRKTDEENRAPVNAAVGATLGLLAFLLAITFGMAESRYNTRKDNVMFEANAIGTTYLRANFLPEPLRSQAHELLREYVTIRMGGENSIISETGIAKSNEIHDRLWIIADEASQDSDSIMSGLFINSLNEMIDLNTIRVVGLRTRIPNNIWMMLIIVTIASMFAIGYQFGLSGAHSWAVTVVLVVVFTTVFVLIADLDRPQEGLIRVSQQALTDLMNKIGTPTP